MTTPKRSAGTGLPLNSRGNGAGACNYCHDDGTSCTDSILVETTMDTHHNVGFGTDATKCSWCHDFGLPFNEQIRVCENCHGRDSLHNIQLDSDNDSMPNWEEFVAGTHPMNPTSCLILELHGDSPGHELYFQFEAISNRSYSIQSKSDLIPSSWPHLMTIPSAPTNRMVRITNSLSPNRRAFFRVKTP